MILNNHRTMIAIEERYKNQELSLNLLLEIHSYLVDKTLDDDGETPKLRADDRPLYVIEKSDGMIYHEAPGIEFVQTELARLINFANDDDGDFLHPMIKACFLHFWIGYLHPFTDGNGRLARVIFYWYLLKKGYWAFAYLPIAAKIKKSGKKGYTMAYVYAEQDDNDLTYFVSYLLKKSVESYRDFQEYVGNARESSSTIASTSRARFGLNERQIQLIKYLSTDKTNFTTIASYVSVYGVSRITANKDLKSLLKTKLIIKKQIGRTHHFFGSDLIESLLKK